MFGNSTDDEFANDIAAGATAARGASYWPLLLALLAGIIAFVVWAWQAEIEEITSGQGRVIPSGSVQIVQTLEGGIVSEISVSEGQIVEKGQALVKIDDTSFSSKLGELSKQEAALVAERYRLEAEAALADALNIPESFETENRVTVLAERGVFLSRKRQLLNELDVLENRLSQRKFELSELAAQEQKLETSLAPMQKEAELTRRMASRGVVPEIEVLRLESRLAEMVGDLQINRAAQPRVEATIQEAENLLQTTRNNYTTRARERLAKLEAELAVIQETIKAAADRVVRSQLTSPVNGVVNSLSISTIGAVVQPGSEIAEIVPINEGLLIEARIRPQDVAFISPNQKASVKLTAYDYLIYGDLEGSVTRIGADTKTDEEGEEYFEVVVRTDQDFLGAEENRLPIIPGMVASVDIQTGQNTVLSYLLKPVLRAQNEAFRER